MNCKKKEDVIHCEFPHISKEKILKAISQCCKKFLQLDQETSLFNA